MKTIHIPRRFVQSHWGGTETVILQTCRELAARGHDTKIMTSMALSNTRHEEIEKIQVERFSYTYPYLGLSKEAKKQLDQKGGNLFSFSLMKALKSEPDVDLLHLHTAKRVGGIVRYIAAKRRIPYVVSVHGGLLDIPTEEEATFTQPTKGKLEWGKALGAWVGSRRVFDDAAAILCLGQEEFRLLKERYPRQRVVQFPNGVDTKRFATGDGNGFREKHAIPFDAKVILVMGRIDPQKNQLLAVNAFQKILDRNPKAHLLLIGHVTNDQYHAKVNALINEHKLVDHTTLIPGVSAATTDLQDAFHAADIFMLPSIHEPFGIVILEAWAAGLPVVASRVGGIPSFVEHEVDGMLVSSGSEDELSESVDRVLKQEEFATQLADHGKAKANREYSWATITDKLTQVYEEVIHENSLRK